MLISKKHLFFTVSAHETQSIGYLSDFHNTTHYLKIFVIYCKHFLFKILNIFKRLFEISLRAYCYSLLLHYIMYQLQVVVAV